MFTLIYLHGFESSPASFKAQQLGAWLRTQQRPLNYVVPALSLDPERAFVQAQAEVERALSCGDQVGIIGSSLGGYYTLALLARYAVRGAIINPAVYPYRLLQGLLGPRCHPRTGERYVLETRHMQSLLTLDTPYLTHPERLLMLLQTGDATLDYREALARYPSPAWIQSGGSHEFDDFVRVIPAALAFLGAPASPGTGDAAVRVD